MQYKNPPNNEPHKRPSEATKPQKNSGCRHLVRTRMKRIFSIAIWALAPLNNRLKVDAIVHSAPWHPDMTSQGNANIVPAFVQDGRCACRGRGPARAGGGGARPGGGAAGGRDGG